MVYGPYRVNGIIYTRKGFFIYNAGYVGKLLDSREEPDIVYTTEDGNMICAVNCTDEGNLVVVECDDEYTLTIYIADPDAETPEKIVCAKVHYGSPMSGVRVFYAGEQFIVVIGHRIPDGRLEFDVLRVPKHHFLNFVKSSSWRKAPRYVPKRYQQDLVPAASEVDEDEEFALPEVDEDEESASPEVDEDEEFASPEVDEEEFASSEVDEEGEFASAKADEGEEFALACRNGDVEEVRRLLADPRVDPGYSNNEAIREACARGHVEVVRLLLADRRVDPTDYYNDTMRLACENGHADVVRLLLIDSRADPGDNDNSAVRQACSRGHVDVVRLLLADPRVNPAAFHNDAIRRASENGHVEVVRLLLADGRIDPSDYSNDAVRWARHKGHVEVVQLLMQDPRVAEKGTSAETRPVGPKFGLAGAVKSAQPNSSSASAAPSTGPKFPGFGLPASSSSSAPISQPEGRRLTFTASLLSTVETESPGAASLTAPPEPSSPPKPLGPKFGLAGAVKSASSQPEQPRLTFNGSASSAPLPGPTFPKFPGFGLPASSSSSPPISQPAERGLTFAGSVMATPSPPIPAAPNSVSQENMHDLKVRPQLNTAGPKFGGFPPKRKSDD